MMKIIKILEISWLVIAIAGIVMGTYKISSGNNEEAVYFYVFTIVAGIFYYMRRKQRIKLEKEHIGNKE